VTGFVHIEGVFFGDKVARAWSRLPTCLCCGRREYLLLCLCCVRLEVVLM